MKDMVSSPEVIHLGAAKQLLNLIERTQKGESRTKTAISLEPPPVSIIPKTSKKLKLLEFDALEVARQLTMIECHLYMKIRPSECLTRSREQKSDNNDNIAAIIVTTNKIAHWVADTVLNKDDSRKRAMIVKQFISVADRCRELKNFSSMIAIVSGLNSPPIRRLKRTWEQIAQKFMTLLAACEMTIDSNKNFSNYRSLLQRITPPCVPFIGLYLTTLTFIQDGAPNNIGSLVNFRKRQKAAEVIEEIQKWQSKPFNFVKVDLIHDYIVDCLKKFDNRPDVSDEFWNLSLEREPRERDDEKMARLLQETGFL
jgi:son of sevenless-like protein